MQVQAQASVSIMGAARGTTWVRVENLAVGTTTEDVVVSWFQKHHLSLTSPRQAVDPGHPCWLGSSSYLYTDRLPTYGLS